VTPVGDWLSLAGVAAVGVVFGVALWSLGGKRPHYRWLERLHDKHLSPRQRVTLVIGLSIGMFVIVSIIVEVMAKH
jgi:hypothetical protein